MVGGMREAGEEGLVDLGGSPGGEVHSAVQEHFHPADHTGVSDFDARKLGGAHLDGEGQALQEREVDMDVGPLGLASGKATNDGEEVLAHRWQMIESSLEPEVREFVGAELVSEEGVLEIDAEEVMAMLHLFERRV